MFVMPLGRADHHMRLMVTQYECAPTESFFPKKDMQTRLLSERVSNAFNKY